MNNDTVKPIPATVSDADDVSPRGAVGEAPESGAHGDPGEHRDADELADDEAEEDADEHRRRIRVSWPPSSSTPALATANSGTMT